MDPLNILVVSLEFDALCQGKLFTVVDRTEKKRKSIATGNGNRQPINKRRFLLLIGKYSVTDVSHGIRHDRFFFLNSAQAA